MDPLVEAVARIVAESGGEIHWTVVLDKALASAAVPPSPDARALVLQALAAAERAGAVAKTSKGTYRRGDA